MKKLLLMFGIFAGLSLIAVSCGSENAKTDEAKSEVSEEGDKCCKKDGKCSKGDKCCKKGGKECSKDAAGEGKCADKCGEGKCADHDHDETGADAHKCGDDHDESHHNH